MRTEPALQEGNVLTIGFVKFGLRFPHRLAQQTIRLRLRLYKSFSLPHMIDVLFQSKATTNKFPQSKGF